MTFTPHRYTFIVVASDSATGDIATDNITLLANQPPIGGQLSASPRTGLALSTEFLLQSSGWADPDGPDAVTLSHSFSYVSNGMRILLGSDCFNASGLVTMHTKLPLGNLSLSVTVRDSVGGATTVTASGGATFAVVLDQGVGAVSTVRNATNEISKLVAAGDGASAMARIAASADTLATAAALAATTDVGVSDDDSLYVEIRAVLIRLAWNASSAISVETESTVALRAAALRLLMGSSQVSNTGDKRLNCLFKKV